MYPSEHVISQRTSILPVTCFLAELCSTRWLQ